MRTLRHTLPTIAGLALLFLAACKEKPSSALQGQVNTTIRFYGLAVNEHGSPLPGARIEYQVDAYPKDWTFETRDRPYDVSLVTATSGADGRFEFEATGCVLRLKRAERAGYRHLYEKNASDQHPSVSGYSLIAWGQVTYLPDPKNPAVFVFVKEGATEVSTLPGVGGSRRDGTRWTPHAPAWPTKPSLKDVTYKPPTTLPVTQR